MRHYIAYLFFFLFSANSHAKVEVFVTNLMGDVPQVTNDRVYDCVGKLKAGVRYTKEHSWIGDSNTKLTIAWVNPSGQTELSNSLNSSGRSGGYFYNWAGMSLSRPSVQGLDALLREVDPSAGMERFIGVWKAIIHIGSEKKVIPFELTCSDDKFRTEISYPEEQKQNTSKRVESETKLTIQRENIRNFELLNRATDLEDWPEVERILEMLDSQHGLNNLERAYVSNSKANLHFKRNDLNGALLEVQKILAKPEGLPEEYHSQIIYLGYQINMALGDYIEGERNLRLWFDRQEYPDADAYTTMAKTKYLLDQHDQAIRYAQKAINKITEQGKVPEEGLYALLLSIYNENDDYKKMLPLLKQMVAHYPAKKHRKVLAAVYNNLDQQSKMLEIYRSLYQEGMLDEKGEISTLVSLSASQGKYSDLIEILTKELDEGRVESNAYHFGLLATAHNELGNSQYSIEYLRKAADLSENGELDFKLGAILLDTQDWQGAEAALSRSITKGGLKDFGRATQLLEEASSRGAKRSSAPSSLLASTQQKELEFTIGVAEGCSEVLQFVDVFYDNNTLTRLIPGTQHQFVTSRGNHSIRAISNSALSWGPIERKLEVGGSSEILNCDG